MLDGRLLAADVLLAGLQRQAQRLVAVGVHRHPDQAAGQRAGQVLADRHVAGVRAAEAQRHAEALRGAHGDVGAGLAGRGEQGQGQQVGGDRDQRAARVGGVGDGLEVADLAGGAGVLDQHAVELALGQVMPVPGSPPARSASASSMPSGSARVWSTARVCGKTSASTRKRGDLDLEARRASVMASAAAVASSSREELATGQPGQVGDHGLEVEQRLQPALGDLRLVGRVGGVPGRVLHDVAQDHRRGEGAVVAQADHRTEDPVAPGDVPQLGQHLGLRTRRRQVQALGEADGAGHSGLGQRVQRVIAEQREHVRGGLGVGPDVPVGERRAVLQLDQRRPRRDRNDGGDLGVVGGRGLCGHRTAGTGGGVVSGRAGQIREHCGHCCGLSGGRS